MTAHWTTPTAAYEALVTALFRSEVNPRVCPPDTDATEEFTRHILAANGSHRRARTSLETWEFWCWETLEEV